jgi:hypothetical protein
MTSHTSAPILRWAALALAVLALASAGIFLQATRPGMPQDAGPTWVCPMHPDVHQTSPGHLRHGPRA